MLAVRGAVRALGVALLVAVLAGALPVRPAAAAEADDVASDIVLVLDFSGSILTNVGVRSAFANALDRIAARVAETQATLVAGDATVSIVQFATQAADAPGCTSLALRENPQAVTFLADCLRRVATTYRSGGDPALTDAIGDDTNYVAAMEQAAGHLPEDSARPAIIFFTDGRHEADGVPVGEVIPARDRLFGARSPFALLPVGMGVDPEDRPRLEAGLVDLRTIRAFETCDGGAFDWPDVVFETADAAGQAVAVALQNVSCTFTVEPSATPDPVATPRPEPPAPVRSIRLAAGDSAIELTWVDPNDPDAPPAEDYRARCRPLAGGDWVESTEGVSTQASARVEGLANGVEYVCEVVAVAASGVEALAAASLTATPIGRPPTPSKPAVEIFDRGARLSVALPANAPVDGFTYQCSTDGGATWSIEKQVAGSLAATDLVDLTNGTAYVCRAFATNGVGQSDASPLSDVFRPCAGFLDCNPLVLPLFGAMAALLAAAAALALFRFYSARRVWVTAQVDNFASVSLGRGPSVGMAFVRRGSSGRLTGIVPARGRAADVRIRYTGRDRFEVRGAGRPIHTEFGRMVEVRDSRGEAHSIVLRAFDQPPADS